MVSETCPERQHLNEAVAALCDRHAAEIPECEAVLKFEAEVGRRRVAEARLIKLTEPKERAA